MLESALSQTERNVLAVLDEVRAVKPHKVDLQYVLCPYCQLHRGLVIQSRDGLSCQCPDCGDVPVDEVDRRAWMFDTEWLIRKLRRALDIPSQQDFVVITSSMWRIGKYQRQPVMLARSLNYVVQKPSLLGRARSTSLPWLMTPKPMRDVEDDPLAGMVSWLPMEERFWMYGGNLSFIEPGELVDETVPAATEAVNGPFSIDFRWVHLPDETVPVLLSKAQAAVFMALWHFGNQPRDAHTIMSRAQLSSDKPIDVFKVKTQNKGNPKYEGPLRAYSTLVTIDQRDGTYAMPCAARSRS